LQPWLNEARAKSRSAPRAGVRPTAPSRQSNGRVVQGEPPRQVGLDRKLLLELRLELELFRVVTLLTVAHRDERPERRRLEAVDEVDGVLASGETERRGEQLLPEARIRQLRRDQVRRIDEILEVVVAHDQPL